MFSRFFTFRNRHVKLCCLINISAIQYRLFVPLDEGIMKPSNKKLTKQEDGTGIGSDPNKYIEKSTGRRLSHSEVLKRINEFNG